MRINQSLAFPKLLSGCAPTIQSEWVQPRVCVLDVTIEGGVVPSHSDGVLANVVAEFRRVVAEAVVVQACFHVRILTLEAEWDKIPIPFNHLDVAVDVQHTVPYLVSSAIKGLRWCAKMILYNAVAIFLGKLRHRRMTLSVIHPCRDIR